MQRAITLFSKLAQVFSLATANHALCKHEVMFLKVRCYSLGCFWPVNYPNANVKPKLHLLAHHFPQKAERQGSVGTGTEQLIEGMHPVMNQRECQYASIRDPKQQMALMAKSQWVASATGNL